MTIIRVIGSDFFRKFWQFFLYFSRSWNRQGQDCCSNKNCKPEGEKPLSLYLLVYLWCRFIWKRTVSDMWSTFSLCFHFEFQLSFLFWTFQWYFQLEGSALGLRSGHLRILYIIIYLPDCKCITDGPEHHFPIPEQLHALNDVLIVQKHLLIEAIVNLIETFKDCLSVVLKSDLEKEKKSHFTSFKTFSSDKRCSLDQNTHVTIFVKPFDVRHLQDPTQQSEEELVMVKAN